MQRTGAWLGVLTLADAGAVVGLRPSAGLVAELTAPHAWLARVGADGAVTELAAAALWLAACWLAVGLVAAGVAAMPGAGGRAGRRLAAVVLPRAVYRLVAGATGLGIVLTPLAAGAAAPRGAVGDRESRLADVRPGRGTGLADQPAAARARTASAPESADRPAGERESRRGRARRLAVVDRRRPPARDRARSASPRPGRAGTPPTAP